MNQFQSLEEEDEYWERRIAEHPFCRMQSAMDEIQTFGCHGDKLRQKEQQKAEVFWQYWNDGARDWLKEQGQHGTVALEDVEDELTNGMEINNVLMDVDILLLNAGMYEERLSVCEDLLGFFQWKDDPAGEASLRSFIGESMERLGKRESSDSYFQTLLSDDPENVEYINMYLNCLCERKAYEEAKVLLEKHLTLDTDVTEENSILFWRAEEIYEGLGNAVQALCYRAKREIWENNNLTTISPMNGIAAELLAENSDFMKEFGAKIDMDATATKLPTWTMQGGEIVGRGTEKIYPNDPCPCGSGKKFKKCCGKRSNSH